MAKPGPRPKGERGQITLRVPREHRQVYEAEAAAANLSLTDYLALTLARATGLDEPEYISRARGQLELPIGS